MDNQQHVGEDRPFFYRIARHVVEIRGAADIDIARCLPSFEPFAAQPGEEDDSLITVRLTIEPAPEIESAKLLSDISVIWEERFCFEETDDSYITTIQAKEGDRPWKMVSSKDFRESVIYAQADELYSTFKCNWLIMIAFGQAGLLRDTLLIHASVVERAGKGYAFLGKSGTGKSTHSRLWTEHIDGTKLLNDDNPAIRVYDDGQVSIYGTPWSGKTPCYRQVEVQLGAIIRLEQAPFNRLDWKQGKEALVALLPSGSAIRWNPTLFASMLQILEEILTRVPVGVLRCLPDGGAAKLCFSEIGRKLESE